MKKTISLLLALLLCIGLTSPAHASAAPFADVPSSHWAYKEIMEAYKDGAVQGTSANVYNPNGNVTMAQFIAILTRAFLLQYDWVKTLETDGGAWYALNYRVAEMWGLFCDIPDNAPETEVTREVMAQIMYNLMSGYGDGAPPITAEDWELQAAKSKIPDFGSVSDSMRDAVAYCYALGLITGTDSSGRFSPQGRMNRAQTAVIYVRLKQVMETGTGIASQTGTGTSAETSGATLTNGKPVTEENVLALIMEYHDGKAPVWEKAINAGFTTYRDFEEGGYYDAYKPPYYSAAKGSSGTECAKFAFAFWDELFGDLPMRAVTNVGDIRPGDLLDYGSHWAIATTGAYKDESLEEDERLGYGKELYWIMDVGGGATGAIGWALDHGHTQTVISNDPADDFRYIRAYTRYPD